jgi:predicted phosphodiesterase
MNTSRMEHESIIDYSVRVCESKDTLGLSWKEVAALINAESGEDFSPDKYRKWWATWQQCREYYAIQKIEDWDLISETEEKLRELRKEKVKLADQRREYNKLLRDEARSEQFYDIMLEEIRKLSETKPLIALEKPLVNFDVDAPWREAAMLFSDWHVGLFAVNYWNQFDEKELRRRVRRVLSKSIEHMVRNQVRVLHLFNMGDFINGLIHVTTRILATEDAATQTRKVAEILAECICEYAKYVDKVYLYFVRGNHDRVTPNKSDEIAKESFADFIPWYLQARLSHLKNVHFVRNMIDDEIAVAKICGKLCYALHGHRDKPSSVAADLTMMLGEKPDYIFMGHYHKHFEDEVHEVEIIINSSLSGVDTYAKEIRKTSKPAQKLIIFNEEEGRECTYNIRLDIA